MASILTGTPINTAGVHPLAAIMGQGSDILTRSFGMAANRMTANNNIAINMMRDAMSERMEFDRQRLAREKMALTAELQREAMDQRDRHFQAELASREKMAADRLALAGRRSSGVSTQQGGGIDMGGLMSAILGQSFQQAGGQGQAPPQQSQGPLEGPTTPPGFQQDGGQQFGPNLPLEAYEQQATAGEMRIREVQGADLSRPENVDALDELYGRQAAYNAIAAQIAPTASSQLMYGGKAIQSRIDQEKYRIERSKGANGDISGLAAVDRAIQEQLDPYEGFTGRKFVNPKDLEAMAAQDPTLRGSLAMLSVDSTQLRRDLEAASIDELGNYADYFNKAAGALDTQLHRASYLATAASPSSSRTDARKIVQESFNDPRTVQGKIFGHRDAIEDLLVSRIKDADLSKLSPRTIANAGFKLQNSIAGAEARLETITSRQDFLRDEIRDTIKSVAPSGVSEEEIEKWGSFQLEKAKSKAAEGFEEPMDSPEYRRLSQLHSAWNQTSKEMNRENARIGELQAQFGRVSNFGKPRKPSQDFSDDEGNPLLDIEDYTPPSQVTPGDLSPNQRMADDLFRGFGQ